MVKRILIKTSITMYTIKLLNRHEMKSVVAGSLRTVGINNEYDYLLGSVQCTEDFEDLACCRVHYPGTAVVYPAPNKGDEELLP